MNPNIDMSFKNEYILNKITRVTPKIISAVQTEGNKAPIVLVIKPVILPPNEVMSVIIPNRSVTQSINPPNKLVINPIGIETIL